MMLMIQSFLPGSFAWVPSKALIISTYALVIKFAQVRHLKRNHLGFSFFLLYVCLSFFSFLRWHGFRERYFQSKLREAEFGMLGWGFMRCSCVLLYIEVTVGPPCVGGASENITAHIAHNLTHEADRSLRSRHQPFVRKRRETWQKGVRNAPQVISMAFYMKRIVYGKTRESFPYI